MEEELQNKLYDRFPNLFVNRNLDKRQSPMAYGITCGEGWYNILYSLCYLITRYEENYEHRKRYSETPVEEYTNVTFDQIKEKFGSLTIYYTGGDQFIKGAVAMASNISYKTCEVCGNIGTPNTKGWIRVLCDKDREELEKNKK